MVEQNRLPRGVKSFAKNAWEFAPDTAYGIKIGLDEMDRLVKGDSREYWKHTGASMAKWLGYTALGTGLTFLGTISTALIAYGVADVINPNFVGTQVEKAIDFPIQMAEAIGLVTSLAWYPARVGRQERQRNEQTQRRNLFR